MQGQILSSQELSEFEKEMASLGIIKDNINLSSSEQNKDDGQLSLSEERAWMLHQQDPLSAAGPFCAAFRLSGTVDLQRLTAALVKLYKGDSNLNQVYKLDDDGELIKQHFDFDIEIEVNPVTRDGQVIEFLLTQQSTPIDLTSQPALTFWLFKKSDTEAILAMLGHHILIDDSAWKPIFGILSAHYNGQTFTPSIAQAATTKPALEILENYWSNTYSHGFARTPLPELFYKSAEEGPISLLGASVLNLQSAQARRYISYLPTARLETLAQTAQASAFQTLLTLFGIYLNQLLDKTSVDVVIPVIGHKVIQGLNEIGSSSNVIPVSVANKGLTLTESIVELRNALLTGLAHNLPIERIYSLTKTRRNAGPNILVTQVDDASHYLTLEDVKAESLAVPPLSSDYDLTLAVQFEASGQARLELTTGNKLSNNIGAFLLEKFCYFVTQSQPDNRQIIASLFSSEAQPQMLTEQELSEREPAGSTTISQEKQEVVQAILCEFQAVLERPDMQADADFFEQGGHSLLATRVIGKLKTQHNIEVKIADFFNAPSAIELAQFAHYSAPQVASVETLDEEQEIIAPHSFIQMTYMDLIKMGRNPIFNIPFVLKLSQAVNEEAFYQAFTDVIRRHHTLRTLLLIESGKDPLQRVIPASSIKDYQWFFPSSQQQGESAQRLLSKEASHSFDLVNELPLRVRFVYNAKGEHFLSVLIYHTAFDEWSTGVFMGDLFHAYKHYAAGKQPEWSAPPAQFHQFVVEQRQSNAIDQHLQYWQQTLGKVEPAKSLFHLENGPIPSTQEGNWLEFDFDHSVTDRLNQLAQSNKSSMFHVVYAAFSLAMYYLGAGKKVLVGTSTYGRDDPRYQDTVGLFTNVILNHVNFSEELTIGQLIQHIKDDIIASLPYGDVPFVTVEHAVTAQPMTSPSDNLCEVYIQYHQKNALNTAIELDDGAQIPFELLEPERDIAKFGLHFEAYENPYSDEAPLRVVLAYRTSHYTPEQISLVKNVSQAVVYALANSLKHEVSLRDIRKQLAEEALS